MMELMESLEVGTVLAHTAAREVSEVLVAAARAADCISRTEASACPATPLAPIPPAVDKVDKVVSAASAVKVGAVVMSPRQLDMADPRAREVSEVLVAAAPAAGCISRAEPLACPATPSAPIPPEVDKVVSVAKAVEVGTVVLGSVERTDQPEHRLTDSAADSLGRRGRTVAQGVTEAKVAMAAPEARAPAGGCSSRGEPSRS